MLANCRTQQIRLLRFQLRIERFLNLKAKSVAFDFYLHRSQALLQKTNCYQFFIIINYQFFVIFISINFNSFSFLICYLICFISIYLLIEFLCINIYRNKKSVGIESFFNAFCIFILKYNLSLINLFFIRVNFMINQFISKLFMKTTLQVVKH